MIQSRAKKVLQIEAESILGLIPQIDSNFEKIVQAVFECQGKVIITGIGKSGQIARKMASTLSSTGTPALFLHPSESSHGDLGVISANDLVIALSYGGEATELNAIVNFASRRGQKIIALTGKPESILAQSSTLVLNVSVEKEACPLNLAPTSSSTAMLAMSDAIAMCVLDLRGFKVENFAEFHPSGSLGAKLFKVKDLMKSGHALPIIDRKAGIKDILTKMTHAEVRGAVVIQSSDKKLEGIITDGDIRRYLEKNNEFLNATAENIMSNQPKTIDANELVEKALFLMEQFRVQVLVVLDRSSKNPFEAIGLVMYQDLLSAKVR